ncbi:sigma-70 family RNA polymerase sigma factor [Brytella acorum]|uniref:Sigma-70 family RNA polymerase sigma factor n=1 Tax=Brytella acorum TaxID=2959299 RepID=A0AA35UZH5_9PROT|nr:sigma-70 family RNA polymerase sigma factor [Brytella acorum]MDF3626068.1 sigma-70 family RNA polymerase sigma factor [Brytella acorum]CAI9122340.1 sigma-70 family RNA polymerase sigma factor [Brytella acorum]
MESKDKSLLQTYLAHRSRLHTLASRLVGCRVKGEDIVQDAYLRLHTGALSDEVRVKRPFQYLWSVVYRLALDARRDIVRDPASTSHSISLESQSADEQYAFGREVEDLRTPERGAIAREDLVAVIKILEGLPLRTRKAFELNQIHGLAQREIAQMLGVSPPRVSAMIRDAARRLNDAFGDED